MIKNGEYTLYVDTRWNGGLFDLAPDGKLSKVLKMFYTEDSQDKLKFSRFAYSNKLLDIDYRLATESDLSLYGCFYFNEDGSRPFKKAVCESCKRNTDCFLKDSDMRKYGVKCYENN
jgi:hypothetical protein